MHMEMKSQNPTLKGNWQVQDLLVIPSELSFPEKHKLQSI